MNYSQGSLMEQHLKAVLYRAIGLPNEKVVGSIPTPGIKRRPHNE